MAAEEEVASVNVQFGGDASQFEETLESMQGDAEEAATEIQGSFDEAFEEIDEDIDHLQEKMSELDGTEVNPEANLTGDADEKVDAIDTDLTNLDKKVSEPEANLTGDAAEKVGDIDTDLTSLDKKVSEPEANLTGDAAEKVGDLDTDLTALGKKTEEPKADLAGDAFEKVTTLDSDLDELGKKVEEPKVDLGGDAVEEVSTVKKDVESLDGQHAEVTVDATGDAPEKVGALETVVTALTDDPHEIVVDAETADADTKLAAVKLLLDSLRSKDITINVNGEGAQALLSGEPIPVDEGTKADVTKAADAALEDAINDGVADVDDGAIDTDNAKKDVSTFMEGAIGDILNDAGKDISKGNLGSVKENFITAATPGLVEAISSGILIPLGGAILGAAETAIGGGAWLVANLTGQNNPVAKATKTALTNALSTFDAKVTSTSADKQSLTALLGTVTASLNDLVPLATGFATGLTAICNALTPLLNSTEVKAAFQAIGQQIATSGKAAAPGIANFVKGVVQLLNNAAPLINAVSSLIDQLMGSFASASTGKKESNGFKQLATEMSANAPNIKLLFDALANFITAGLTALKPFEAASLTALTGSLQAAANVLTAMQPVFNAIGALFGKTTGAKGAGSEVADIAQMTLIVGAWKVFIATFKGLAQGGVKAIVEKMTGGLTGSGSSSLSTAANTQNTAANTFSAAVQEFKESVNSNFGGKGGGNLGKDLEKGAEDGGGLTAAGIGTEVADDMAPVVLRSTGAALAGVAWASALVTMPATLGVILSEVTRTNPLSKTNVTATQVGSQYGTAAQQAAFELALKQAATTGKPSERQTKQLTPTERKLVGIDATDYSTKGKTAAEDYATGYINQMTTYLAAMGTISTKAGTTITKAFDKSLGNSSPSTISKQSGQWFMQGLENGINDAPIRTNINNSLKTRGGNMVGNLRGYEPQFNAVGMEMMQAMAAGIASGQAAVVTAVNNAVSASIAAAQSTIATSMQKAATNAVNSLANATRGI